MISLENQPAVTVLMSVYNGELWLEKSIASVQNQTFKNFELIIVNDGSNDKTQEITERLALADPRIRTFNKENTGLADSLNYGLERARGTWIARLDADDMCRADRLEKQVEAVKKNKELVLIGSDLHIIDEHDHVVKPHRFPTQHSALLHCFSHALPFFPHSSAFFNLKVVKILGGYRTQFLRSQDLDLWLRLAECGKIASIDEPLVKIRKHRSQMSFADSGQLQTVYSHIAMSSYWLRAMGLPDPADKNNEGDFGCFEVYVKNRLHQAGVFKVEKKINAIKGRLSGTRSQFARIALLAFAGMKSPIIIFGYLKHRAIGSSIPRRLAEGWAK